MKILFICMSNARRSPMAEAIYNKLVGSGAKSAGIDPVKNVEDNVIVALKEIGIELNTKPKKVTEEMLEGADKIITFGQANYIPEKFQNKVENWDYGRKRKIGEPQLQRSLDDIRKIRDDVNKLVEDFIKRSQKV